MHSYHVWRTIPGMESEEVRFENKIDVIKAKAQQVTVPTVDNEFIDFKYIAKIRYNAPALPFKGLTEAEYDAKMKIINIQDRYGNKKRDVIDQLTPKKSKKEEDFV